MNLVEPNMNMIEPNMSMVEPNMKMVEPNMNTVEPNIKHWTREKCLSKENMVVGGQHEINEPLVAEIESHCNYYI